MNEKSGQWLLTTVHSSYIVDYDDKTVQRTTRLGLQMRKDQSKIPFYSIQDPVIGEGCLMCLQIVDRPVFTTRLTSDVVSFERLENDEPTTTTA